MQTLSGQFIPMLLKVGQEPAKYLPQRNLQYLQVFMSGYSNGLSLITEAKPDDEGRLWNDFQQHISQKYRPVGSVFITVYGAGYDDEEAWSLFFRELESFLQQREIRIGLSHLAGSSVDKDRYRDMMESVFQRPWMYLGCMSATLFSIFIQGVLAAEALFSSESTIYDDWRTFEEGLSASALAPWRCMWHRRFLINAGFDEAKALESCVNSKRADNERND